LEPLISIIVPVYNVEEYLPRCLDSIINQSYKNLEIILINDESTDNSLSICKEFKKKDKRIKLISIKHGGLSKARNTGLDVAKGEYIGFVDSDDFIEEDMYKSLYEAIVKSGAQISVCTFYRYHPDVLEYDFLESRDEIVFDKEEAIENVLIDKTLRNYVWTKLYSAYIFDDLRFPEGKNFEDIFISIKILEKIDKLIYINKFLYYYVIREGSIDSSKKVENIKDAIEETYRRYKYIKENYEKYKEYNIAAMIVRLVYCYLDLNQDISLLNEYNYIFSELDKDISSSDIELIKSSCVNNFYNYYCDISSYIEK
jgi:glycosyltransferase involved in cell wall biosynthesis